MKKILSIIIPSYKTSKYMDECLKHFVVDSIEKDVDIFLIDDGSPDDSYEKSLNYQKKYPGLFHAVHKENGGHGSVINYAIKYLIDTKYFKVVDGDDWVNEKDLLELIEYLKRVDDELIVSDYTCVYSNKTTTQKCFDTKNNNSFKGYKITIHSSTFKTNLFKDNNIFLREKVFYEDNEYVLFPLEFAKTISYCECNVYQYRLGDVGQSVSISSLLKHDNDYRMIKDDIYNKYLDWIKKQIDPNLIDYGKKVLIGFYLWIFQSQILKKESKEQLLNINNEIKDQQPLFETIRRNKIYRFVSSFNFGLLTIKRFILKCKYKI